MKKGKNKKSGNQTISACLVIHNEEKHIKRCIESFKDLGKRQLAYRISKHTKGHYWQLNFSGTGETVSELEKFLRISEDVIRFLTVREPEISQTLMKEAS